MNVPRHLPLRAARALVVCSAIATLAAADAGASPFVPTITVFAGTGSAGFSGDGGPATAAQLHDPVGLVVDARGAVFIADSGNGRVRTVDAHGVITTIAGNGDDQPGPDHGPATAIHLNTPMALALDAHGDPLVVDWAGNRVFRIDGGGRASVLAGRAPAPDDADGDGGPATAAAVVQPNAIAVDGRGIFISDGHDNAIRLIDAAGTINRFAGGKPGAAITADGAPALGATLMTDAIAADGHGGLLIASGTCVRRIDARGIITTIAGNIADNSPDGSVTAFAGDGGPATAAKLANVDGIAVDARGTIFLGDFENHRIRAIDARGIITTIAGTDHDGAASPPCAATAIMLSPAGIAVDGAGNLYVSDARAQRVYRVHYLP
jgi:serine/threonine-protein kinase